MCKALEVADLRRELRANREANNGHGHDSLILRELGSQVVHFCTEHFGSMRDGVKLSYSLSHQQFGDMSEPCR